MFWWNDLDYIQITPSQTTLQLWWGGMIVQTSLPTYDDLPKNQIRHICEKQEVGVKEFVYSFDSIMNALAMGMKHKEMWNILCLGKPFDNQAMVTKSLGEFMVEKRIWICATCL